MRRKVTLGALAGMVLALVYAGVTQATDGRGDHDLVIRVISRATPVNDFVDTGAPGSTPGDLYVFSDRLFSPSAPSRQIGTVDGHCVLIQPAELRFDCSLTTRFAEGDIVSAGTIRLVEGTTSVGAITGGTGAYENARGEGALKLGPLAGPHEATYFLILRR